MYIGVQRGIMSRVLVVDDEKTIVKGLQFSLARDGMTVDCAYDGEMALEYARNNEYDMVLLDVMLPNVNGMEVCQKIREFSDMPIIMLTAKGDDMDKIMGLDCGADDYITKPFNILEVKARMKAIMRRIGSTASESKSVSRNVISISGLTLDKNLHQLRVKDRYINLTSKEFEVMQLLMTNPNKVYSRDELLKIVWGSEYPGDARTVDVHIRRLREKIEDNPSEPQYIQTKWGAGYYLGT